MALARIVGGKGDKVEGCLCKHNLDLSIGCPSGNIRGFFRRNSNGRCEYCYGRRSNYHKFRPKKINLDLLEKDIKLRKIKILRVGKFSDPGYRSLKESLANVLRLCNKLKVKVILITKLLEFDKKVAELLKSTDSVIHFSLGYDHLERGANWLGMSNNKRLKVAHQYSRFGVRTYLRLVKDITVSADDVSKKAFNSKIPIIITPLRFARYDLAKSITGKSISELKTHRFIRIPGYLNPRIMHDDFSQIREICGEIGEKRYCAKCGLGETNA